MLKYACWLIALFMPLCVGAQNIKYFKYQGEVNTSYSFCVDEELNNLSLEVINGVRFSRYLYAGVGLGATANFSDEAILNGYERDFSKHAPKDQIARIRLVWQTLPSQLFKENKKFIYGSIKHGARAKDFEIAIQWLVDAGLVYKVPLCKEVKLPLKVYEDPSAFKLFTLDLGLLGAMVGTEAKQVLIKNEIFSEYKGGMTEQFILEEMKSHGEENIFYHKTNDGTRLEIDFLIQRNGKLLPIEVKAEGNVRANSLSNLLKQNPELHAIRYSMKPYIEQPQMTCYPLYAIQ